MSATFCTVCGAKIEEGSGFCTQCGAKIEQNTQDTYVAPEAQQFQPAQQPQPVPQPQPQPQPPQFAQSNINQPPVTGSMYEPVSTGAFFGTILLLSIPLVGFIYCIVCAFGGCRKVNMRNFCRAQLIWILVGLVLSIIGCVLVYLLAMSAGGSINEFFDGIMRSV